MIDEAEQFCVQLAEPTHPRGTTPPHRPYPPPPSHLPRLTRPTRLPWPLPPYPALPAYPCPPHAPHRPPRPSPPSPPSPPYPPYPPYPPHPPYWPHSPRRSASALTIFSPWKRPFSMKMLPVARPADAPPARKRFGTFVSNVSGFSDGASVSGSHSTPARRIRSASG